MASERLADIIARAGCAQAEGRESIELEHEEYIGGAYLILSRTATVLIQMFQGEDSPELCCTSYARRPARVARVGVVRGPCYALPL